MKGCGKEFLDKFWGRRICGNFEDLKHSNHFIYCDDCSQNLKNTSHSKIKNENNIQSKEQSDSHNLKYMERKD